MDRGREFVAGGFGGMAGVISGYPLDTLRIRQQYSNAGSPFSVLRGMVAAEGPAALYRGMGAPLASITFQNALVFQIHAVLTRTLSPKDAPSYKAVALAGFGTGALQSLTLTPIELVKIRLQLKNKDCSETRVVTKSNKGPIHEVQNIYRIEGLRGMYRGLTITALRDMPGYAFYFLTYEYMREKLHPGGRESGKQSLSSTLIAGGLAGVACWVSCYPLDVVKTRLQAQSQALPLKYNGIVDCFRKSVREDGYGVLWRGLGTAVARAFVVNGAVFAAYEIALKVLGNNSNGKRESIQMEAITIS